MPIDPRIPLGVQPLQLPSPLEIYQTVQQIQGLREQTEARRLAAEEARERRAEQQRARHQQAAVDRALQAAIKIDDKTGRITFDRQTLLAGVPATVAYKLQQELDEDEVSANTLAKSLLELEDKKRTYRGSIGRTIRTAQYNPATFRPLMQGAHGFGALDDALRTQYEALEDPAAIQAVVDDWIAQGGDETPLQKVTKYDPATGQTIETFVRPTEGAEFVQPPAKAPNPPAVGSFEDYLTRSPEQRAVIDQAREQYRLDPQVTVNTGGTGPQDRDALISAVIENPGLWDQITPTERGRIAGELRRRGFTGFGKPLSDGAVAKITESKSAIASLTDLRKVLLDNEQYIGPLAGLQAMNPYSEARKAQADIDRVRQRVGKALEGGVLRKEDEEKYKKILATLHDEPGTAIYKVDQLIEDIQRDIATYTNEQRLQGRRVPQNEAPAGSGVPPKEGDVKPIPGYPGTEQTYRNGKWIRTK